MERKYKRGVKRRYDKNENTIHFSSKIFVEKSLVLETKNEYIAKRKNSKNLKIVFVYILEHCAYFGPKNSILSL